MILSLSLPLQISPLFGPLAGGIALTLRGSNLGVRAGDVRRITVAGVECVHLEDRYSVSTRSAGGECVCGDCVCV